jgi:hypothetical protein
MCGCLLLPFKIVFFGLKLVFFLILFVLALTLLPFLLLAGLVCLIRMLF